jgi:hypothetical protein
LATANYIGSVSRGQLIILSGLFHPDSFFLKLKVEFTDQSSLFTKEYFSKTVRNYSFHWQDINDNLLIRWDNAPFHKSIDTFPHHKHKDNKVISSMEIGLEDVLKYIFEILAC